LQIPCSMQSSLPYMFIPHLNSSGTTTPLILLSLPSIDTFFGPLSF
jgi:hypothetical protein